MSFMISFQGIFIQLFRRYFIVIDRKKESIRLLSKGITNQGFSPLGYLYFLQYSSHFLYCLLKIQPLVSLAQNSLWSVIDAVSFSFSLGYFHRCWMLVYLVCLIWGYYMRQEFIFRFLSLLNRNQMGFNHLSRHLLYWNYPRTLHKVICRWPYQIQALPWQLFDQLLHL